MDKITILPYEVERIIQGFIEKKFHDDKLRDKYPNLVLRDDVLEILDEYCKVVYYPLRDGDHNNGFQLKGIPFADGTSQNFVFINTAQRMEKQVFTAAHELGHIWDVDKYVISAMLQSGKEFDDTPENREQIINRFAAVLLLPENEFRTAVDFGLNTLGDEKNRLIAATDLLRLIVVLMKQFFAPMKSIALRLVELGYFNVDAIAKLLGMKEVPQKAVDDYVDALIIQLGYYEDLKATNKKWIEGLPELLDTAEKGNLVSKEKIELMRERFGLKPIKAPSIDDVIPLES